VLVKLLWFIGSDYASPNRILFPKGYVCLANKAPIELLFPTFIFCGYTPPIEKLFPKCYVGLVY
jgi:hypothetical protein